MHYLRQGQGNEEAVQELTKNYRRTLEDEEDAKLFWFALADTQWEYGRLLPYVKEKALYYATRPDTFEWKNNDLANRWSKTVEELMQKLNSPQPTEKRIRRYRLYQCKWQLGDVYAYRFHSEYSKDKGMYGKYIIFRKVSEYDYWPGHVVPIVQCYKWIGPEIPTLDQVTSMSLLEIGFYPTALEYHPDSTRMYNLIMCNTSSRVIPVGYLSFLGNIQGPDLTPLKKNRYYSFPRVEWNERLGSRYFENYIIDFYLAWKDC